ncbi:hypothetical protein [Actinoallomurus sp. NPDC050550]|uniref:hypothetical protein n=1 Tax=Actinoallomurus sp. NPDC050550 TaxID=3154937 RepID=UPI003411AA59
MGEPREAQHAKRDVGGVPPTSTEAETPVEEEDPDSGPSTGPAHPEDFSPDDFE